jgi:hypothetical protein
MSTLQWHSFYPAEELHPDDTDRRSGNQRKVTKWISFEELQEWHPDFKRDHY